MDPTTTALAEAFINTSSDCFTDRYGLHRFQAPLKCERTKSYIKRAVGMPCAIWMAELTPRKLSRTCFGSERRKDKEGMTVAVEKSISSLHCRLPKKSMLW